MKSVFIDGQIGTTGLQIVQRLSRRSDIEIVHIDESRRKDTEEKRRLLNSVDSVILCLPDDAAVESVGLITNPSVKVLDASTAHRIAEGWVYGMPELKFSQRQKIREASFVSVPGCYPTGFLLAIAPLVESGVIPPDYPVVVNAVSGYSGGGRRLIETYRAREEEGSIEKLWPYRPYALKLEHKHLPEMKHYAGLSHNPLFSPAVGQFYQGMLVMVPLLRRFFRKNRSAEDIQQLWEEKYGDEHFINILPHDSTDILEEGFLSPLACNGTNRLDLMVFGNEEQIIIISRLDNLGKGASGAAVQNLNIMLGIDETEGLISS